MIMDKLTEFGDAVDLADASGTFSFPNQIDLQEARDVGNGQPIYLVISVDEEIKSKVGAGTIEFRLVSSALVNLSSPNVHFSTGALTTDNTTAVQVAGDFLARVALPWEGNEYLRFLGVQAVVATQDIDEGKVSAFLTFDPHGWKAKKGVTGTVA